MAADPRIFRQCHTDNKRLQEERQASLAHAASLEQNLLELRKKEEEASRDYSDTLSILRKEVENLRELVKQKDSAISNLKEAEAVRDRQITRLEEAEASSQLSASAAMEKVRRDLKALQAEYEAAIAAHATEKANLLERASTADGKLAECESVLRVRDAEISRLQEQAASDQQGAQKTQEALQKRIEEANAAMSRIQLQLTTLEREQALEVAEITAEYRQSSTELKNTLALAEASVEQQERAATAHKSLISKLQEQLACKDQALATLQDSFNLSQETVSELKKATKQSDQTVRSLTEAINDKDHAIASLREELDKKEQAEQARMKLAQLKAANAPPDFGALQAKMQAVSSRSTSKSLSNSLGSSDSDRMSLTLKAELEASQGKLRETEKTVDSQSRLLRQYEERIAELEADIARFRQVSL